MSKEVGVALQCGRACTDLVSPLCEQKYVRSGDEAIPAVTTAAPNQLSCPPGWTLWNRHCYQYFDVPQPAIASHLACVFENAHEASITSPDEENFIVAWLTEKGERLANDIVSSVVSSIRLYLHSDLSNYANCFCRCMCADISPNATVWIGLHCEQVDECHWTDESPFTYANWESTPTFTMPHVFAAFRLRTRKWFAVDDADSFHTTICKKHATRSAWGGGIDSSESSTSATRPRNTSTRRPSTVTSGTPRTPTTKHVAATTSLPAARDKIHAETRSSSLASVLVIFSVALVTVAVLGGAIYFRPSILIAVQSRRAISTRAILREHSVSSGMQNI